MMKEVQTAVPRLIDLTSSRREPGCALCPDLPKGRRSAIESLRAGTTQKSYRQTQCWWNDPNGAPHWLSREDKPTDN
jgi:hypothetical protein